MKTVKLYAIPAIVLILLGAWWFSPTQVLKRRTLSMLETLTMDATTGTAGRQIGAYTLNSLLAPEVELDTPTIPQANGSFDRSELESAYSWLCAQAKQTHFKLGEFRAITITDQVGKVEFTVDALVELPVYRPADGDFIVTFDWQKGDEGWRLTRATWDRKL